MSIQSVDMRHRRSGPPRRFVAFVVPLSVTAALGCALMWSAWPLLQPEREVRVVQAVPDRASLTADVVPTADSVISAPAVQAPGWLEAEPFYIACAALADGVVQSIEVLEGEYVEAGSVVAKLVAEDSELRLRRAEAELSASIAFLAIAKAELEAATRTWDEPVELERAVESGEAAVMEHESELAQLPSLLASAQATLKGLDEEAARVRRSTERGATNELELIIAEARAAAQQADVEAIEARRPILQARVQRLKAELRAARRDLELRIADRRRLETALSEVTRREAAVEQAKVSRDEAALELERMTIRAPISGFVQTRLKVPGDKVILMMDSPHSAHLVHLYDPQRLQVRVDVPLADAAYIAVGRQCEVIVDVLPDRTFAGEVLRVTHEADLQKNTLQVKVKVIDPDPILRPEMLTRVKFLAGTGGSGAVGSTEQQYPRTLVPAQALVEQDGITQVWTVVDRRNGHGVLRPQRVEVVERAEGWLTVTGDLHAGALIAVDIENPRSGEQVFVRSTAAGGSS